MERDVPHTACANSIFLFHLLLAYVNLTAARADPASSVVARNTNVNAKGEMEACSQDREEDRTEEPGGSRSLACLNPDNRSSTLLA